MRLAFRRLALFDDYFDRFAVNRYLGALICRASDDPAAVPGVLEGAINAGEVDVAARMYEMIA